MNKVGYLVGAAMLAIVAVPAQANLVANGDFGTNSFAGWSQFGNTGFTGVSGGVAFFGPIGSQGGITQNIATTVGQTYTISFDLQHDGGNPNSFSADFGGDNLMSISNGAGFGFTTFSFNTTATSANTALSFSFQQNPAFYRLDNVSLLGAVPEPSAWALLILGFGVVGGALRQSRKTRTALSYA